MKKLFFSYRRNSWPFTRQLANDLEDRLDASIFVDFQSMDETDFESGILRNLGESDAVLVIVSEQTFARERIFLEEDWVRREIREALTLNKPLIMACIDGLLPPADLPEDIRAITTKEGVRFFPEFFEAAVERLALFIARATSVPMRSRAIAPIPLPYHPAPPPAIRPALNPHLAIEEASDLLERGDFNQALDLLDRLSNQDLTPTYERATDVLREKASAGARYDEIAKLIALKATRDIGCQEFTRFRQEHPHFEDSQELRGKCPRPRSIDLLPKPFAWVDISAGPVTLVEETEAKSYFGESRQFFVTPYTISKYPVTNGQYLKFVADGGYHQARWWTEDGWRARQRYGWLEPLQWADDRWNQSDHPVTGVSWYEAVAFCRWLSEITGEVIRLPTEQQWQRAAQGTMRRFYPWGNEFNPRFCNSSAQTDLRKNGTTPVTQYLNKGESPFGVLDMAGNVWQWCLTVYDSGRADLEGTDNRVLRGGAWNTEYAHMLRTEFRRGYAPHERRAHIGFRITRSDNA
jgi:formylglycine-generating enzyme required for sulfatase activity